MLIESKGTFEYFLRPTTSLHLLAAGVRGLLDMARKSTNVRKLHGRLCT